MNQSRFRSSKTPANMHSRDNHALIGQGSHELTFLQHLYGLRRFYRIVMPKSGKDLVVAQAPTAPDRFPRTPMCVIVTSACTRPGSQKVIRRRSYGTQTAASAAFSTWIRTIIASQLPKPQRRDHHAIQDSAIAHTSAAFECSTDDRRKFEMHNITSDFDKTIDTCGHTASTWSFGCRSHFAAAAQHYH